MGTVSSVSALSATSEVLKVKPGSVVEILAVLPDSNATASWVLSKDGSFVQAERSSIFSIRPVQEEEFILLAEIQKSDSSSIQHSINLSVSSSATDPIKTESDLKDKPIVLVEGGNKDQSNIVLNSNQQLIRLDINRDDIDQLLMDADINQDLNLDGNTMNDNVLSDTFFKNGKGTLYLWIPNLESEQTILIGAKLNDESIIAQQIIVTPFGGVTEVIVEEGDVSIESTSISEETIQFALVGDDSLMQSDPSIVLWEFGDGSQSIQDSPKHTFAESGTYEVSAEVRSLRTSEVLTSVKSDVVISITETPILPTDPDNDPEDEEPAEPNNNGGGGSILGLLIKAFLILLVSVAIGILGIFFLSKLKKKSEKEETSNEPESEIEAVKPLSMDMPVETKQEEPKPVTEPPKEDVAVPERIDESIDNVSDTKVPSWLDPSTQPVKSPPEVASSSHRPNSSPTHAPSNTPKPVSNSVNEPKPEPVKEAAPINEPPVKQDQGSTPAPIETNEPNKEPETPRDAPIPDWLKAGESGDTLPAKEVVTPVSSTIKTEPSTPETPKESTPIIEPPTVSKEPINPPVVPKEPVAPPAPEPLEKPSEPSTPAIPSWLSGTEEAKSEVKEEKKEEVVTPKIEEPNQIKTTEPKQPMNKEDWERERKRRKRQRYKTNKRGRELEASKETTETEQPPEIKTPEAVVATEPKSEPIKDVKPEPIAKEEPSDIATETKLKETEDDSDVQFVMSADSIEPAASVNNETPIEPSTTNTGDNPPKEEDKNI
ncbi:hypothetical protein HN512_02365 [Candidatus Peregrinibacteria bacterium]|nr:hypothetical protein [Candidatus Peregrinibacteria bacterium]MBT6730943.1 hypothetical protein [Candidatus Peregrinibacteria bacterium]MBT7930114.1 hypothetical protein [Candidatus Peregrinibacteria bacterium]